MRSRHIEHIAPSGAHSVLRECSLSLFLASRVSLHGRRGPLRERARGARRGQVNQSGIQGRAGQGGLGLQSCRRCWTF